MGRYKGPTHFDNNENPYNLRSNRPRFPNPNSVPRPRGGLSNRSHPPLPRTQLFRVPHPQTGAPFPYRQESFQLSSSFLPQGRYNPENNPQFSTPANSAPQDLRGFTGLESLYWDNNTEGNQGDWRAIPETPKLPRDDQIRDISSMPTTSSTTNSLNSSANNSIPTSSVGSPVTSSKTTLSQMTQSPDAASDVASSIYSPPSFHATSDFAKDLIESFSHENFKAGSSEPNNSSTATLPQPVFPNKARKDLTILDMFQHLPAHLKPVFTKVLTDNLFTSKDGEVPRTQIMPSEIPVRPLIPPKSPEINSNNICRTSASTASNCNVGLTIPASNPVVNGVKSKRGGDPYLSTIYPNLDSVGVANAPPIRNNFNTNSNVRHTPGNTPISTILSNFPFNNCVPQFLTTSSTYFVNHSNNEHNPISTTVSNISLGSRPTDPIHSHPTSTIVCSPIHTTTCILTNNTTGVYTTSCVTTLAAPTTVPSFHSSNSSTLNSGLCITDLLPTIIEQVQVAVQSAMQVNGARVTEEVAQPGTNNNHHPLGPGHRDYSSTSSVHPTNVTFTTSAPIPSSELGKSVYSQGGEIDLEALASIISSKIQSKPRDPPRESDCDSSSSNTSYRSDRTHSSSRSYRHHKKSRDYEQRSFHGSSRHGDKSSSKFQSRTSIHLSDADRTVLIQHGVSEKALRDRDENAEASMNLSDLPCLPQSQFVVNLSSSDISIFSGNLEDYEEFKSSFLAYAQSIPPEQRLMLLKLKLSGQAKNLVSECIGVNNGSFVRAFEILDKRYHRPELLIQKLVAQVEDCLDRSCKYSDSKFASMISNIRRCYQRIFLINPRKVWTLDGLLTKFSNCMPVSCLNNVTKMVKNNLSDHTFSKVLQVCEDYVEFKELQNITTGGTVDHPTVSRSDRSKSPNHRHPGFKSRHYDRKDSSTHALSETSETPTDNSSFDETIAAASLLKSHLSLKTKGKPEADGSRGRSLSRSNGNRSRSGSAFRQKSPFRETFTCNLCNSNDHVISQCTGEFDNLADIVYERKLCRLCVSTGHISTKCPILLLCPDIPIRCKNTECQDIPHCKKLCKIMKKQK